MAKSIEVKAKTVDEAILNGLSELGLGIDQVDVEIVQEGKGFLGLGRSAVIRLTEKQTLASDAEQFLNELFVKMGVQATASAAEEEKSIKVDIAGDSTGILIGRRGETLDSLQYLTSLVVNKGTQDYKRITLDTENYRAKREETLVALANRIASKVARTGKRVVLEPMNPYERRILHATLHNHDKVETVSEGEEPFRRVVVRRKRGAEPERKKQGSTGALGTTSIQM
ncbi:RNA-binding cell elongation regulator Jag/EloR [Christensenellaceae bacterium 44-20]